MSTDFREEYLENVVEEQRKSAHFLWWLRLGFLVAGVIYVVLTCIWIFIDVHQGSTRWFDKGMIAALDLYIAMLLHEKYVTAITELKKRVVALMTYRERRPHVR